MTKWFKKLLGKDAPHRLRRFEVVYREQVWCKTDKEAARLVLNKLRTQHVELAVKQFTSKEGDDVDKAILTFIKTGDPLLRPLLCTECGSIYGKAQSEIIESEITETKTTTTRL